MNELYELPDGWEWSTLSDVCDLLNGFAFKAKDYVDNSNTVIIRMGNIRPNGQFDPEHKIKYLPNKYATELSKYILNEGDLIIAMTDLATEMRILGNPTLISNLNGRTFLLNQRVGKLYDFKYEKIVIEYLRYIITAPQVKDYYKSLGGGGLQINIGKQQILSASFPLPPLQEQKRIVSKLDTLFDKIDKSIALHVENIKDADAFMGSVLNDIFIELEEKYEKQAWNEVLKIRNGKHYKDVIDDNGQYPIYGSGGIMNYANDYLCNENTVIIGRKGTINNPLFVKEKFWNIDTAFGIEANKNVLLPMFLFYFSKNFNFLDLNKSTTLPSLAKTHLLKIMMILPPLNIQQKTVTYLDKISKKVETLKSVQKEKMESLVALKASILDKAFRGEL